MLIQLFIFALLFIGLASWFFLKKKKVLGLLFLLIGLLVMVFFFIVRALYPHKVPF